MERRRVKELLNTEEKDIEVFVQGWARTRRDSKAGFSFIEVNDGSSLKGIQIIADKALPEYEDSVLKITTGSSVEIRGKLVESPGKGQSREIQASEVKLVGTADVESYPLQKKKHSFEFLRTIAHLRPRSNTFGAIVRVRHALSFAIHKFFNERGFYYIHTPIITASDCEGAGQMFRVSTLDPENLPRIDDGDDKGKVDYSKDFFCKPTNLTVSGQLSVENYALAMGNVYTFGPTFRAENSNTSRHLAEFWMVEPEMAFCDINLDMDVAEEFIKYIFKYVLDNCPEDMDFFNRFIDQSVTKRVEGIVKAKFKRLTYTEAVEILEKCGKKFEYPVKWGIDLQAEHERYLTEQHFKKPVILTGYPRAIKPFYMKGNDDGKTVRAMDILFPKIGEIIGGSEREDDYDILLKNMKEDGLDTSEYWWYLELRKYGTVPHAGFGLGLERAVQFVTGMTNIRDVIPFPRTPGSADF